MGDSVRSLVEVTNAIQTYRVGSGKLRCRWNIMGDVKDSRKGFHRYVDQRRAEESTTPLMCEGGKNVHDGHRGV